MVGVLGMLETSMWYQTVTRHIVRPLRLDQEGENSQR